MERGMVLVMRVIAALLFCATLFADPLPTSPQLIETYLQDRESREPGITPGTTRHVSWARQVPQKTPLAVVYLHGYSATRQEVYPLAERIAASLEANLFQTRLTGHGRDGAAMLDGSVRAWQQDALEALRIGSLIGERVILLSTSTGGTLSTWLAGQDHEDALAAMVMISPNFAARDRSLYLFDWPLLGPLLLLYLADDERVWQPANAQQARFWTWRYPYAALPELVRLMRNVESIDKSTIEIPTLMIYSPHDKVIEPAAVVETFHQWGGAHKRLIAFEGSSDPSQHVLAGDVLSPGSTQEIADVIIAYLAGIPGLPAGKGIGGKGQGKRGQIWEKGTDLFSVPGK
jgi:esterase/lipase